jgi:hypothetical protein
LKNLDFDDGHFLLTVFFCGDKCIGNTDTPPLTVNKNNILLYDPEKILNLNKLCKISFLKKLTGGTAALFMMQLESSSRFVFSSLPLSSCLQKCKFQFILFFED